MPNADLPVYPRVDHTHGTVDFEALARQLAPRTTVRVKSAAPDRATYLRRPDLGRILSEESRERLLPGAYDVVFVIADGLSAAAVNTHGPYLAAEGEADDIAANDDFTLLRHPHPILLGGAGGAPPRLGWQSNISHANPPGLPSHVGAPAGLSCAAKKRALAG